MSGYQDFNSLDFGSLMQRANPIFNLMNPMEVPYTENPGKVNNDIQRATQMQWVRGGVGRDAYDVKGARNTNGVPSTESRLFKAVKTCEAVTTPDCNRFKDPTFARDCVITHELGTDSQGKPHVGGLVHFSEDRDLQMAYARSRGIAPAWKPTIGEGAQGKMSRDYQQCVNLQEKLDCERGKSYDLKNCAQCMNGQGTWTRVAADTQKAAGQIVLVGTGKVTVMLGNGASKSGDLSMSEPFVMPLESDAEGTNIYVRVGNPGSTTAGPTVPSDKVIGGYLEGPNNKGTTKLDLVFIVENDLESGARPRFASSTTVNGYVVNTMRPAKAKDAMNLRLYIPFTYISSEEEASIMCPGGPYQTKAASANKIWKDPCADGPGKYSLECLQGRFIEAGCQAADGTVGDAFPNTEVKAQALRYDENGRARTAAQISEIIYQMSIDAKTGMRGGKKLSIPEWDELSRKCYGQPIANPCAMDDQTNGPLSEECIQYLFNNRQGPGKPDGILPTYKLGGAAESRYNQGQYCTKEGTASPYQPDVLSQLQQSGMGVARVQAHFDEIQKKALNNTLSDEERENAMKQCYGINFAKEPAYTGDVVSVTQGTGQKVSLKSAVGNNMFARHASFVGWNHPYENDSLYRQDSSFIQRAALNGKPGYISFESVNYPDFFIVNDGGRMAIRQKSNTITFIRAASWRIGQGSAGGGGCGLPGFESYENDLTPGTFMMGNPNGTEVFIQTVNNEGEAKKACWTRGEANWPY
jgi:hypothetical protein